MEGEDYQMCSPASERVAAHSGWAAEIGRAQRRTIGRLSDQ